MGVVRIKHKGDFKKTSKFLDAASKLNVSSILRKYGDLGVELLSAATPVDTGNTAASWSYEIEKTSSGYKIDFTNSNVNKGVNIAIILQYGHGTRNGGYVQGRDYINPATQTVVDELAEEAWREVSKT